MAVISKAEILLRLQKLEQEAHDLAILVENAEVVDEETPHDAIPSIVEGDRTASL